VKKVCGTEIARGAGEATDKKGITTQSGRGRRKIICHLFNLKKHALKSKKRRLVEWESAAKAGSEERFFF